MLERYLEIQKSELEKLGGQKAVQEERHRVEQQRYDSLQFFHQSLGRHNPDTQGLSCHQFPEQARHARATGYTS